VEIGASVASIAGESHADDDHADADRILLWNVATRYDRPAWGGDLYGLIEYSRSTQGEDPNLRSLLAEAQWVLGPHRPYLRIENATRPEFEREGESGDAFYRYDHDAAPIGTSEWTIWSLGYGYTLRESGVSPRPFVEVQRFGVSDRGDGISARSVLETKRGWGLSFGVRLFLGGDQMRMGSYGVLDPMARMYRSAEMSGMAG